MKKSIIAAASAALAILAAPTASTAAIYTGVLDGENFYVEFFVPQLETRPLRFDFQADMTKIDGAFLTIGYLVGFYGTDDMGPGRPRLYYGDSYDIWDDFSAALTPTGFSFTLDTADNAHCNAYKDPYFCDFAYVYALSLEGSAVSGPVAYRYQVTAIPEPATWALMIGGFSLAGGALRRRQAVAGRLQRVAFAFGPLERSGGLFIHAIVHAPERSRWAAPGNPKPLIISAHVVGELNERPVHLRPARYVRR